MRNFRIPVIVALVLMIGACGDSNKATVLHYAEQEQGGEPYRSRFIVTSRWLRIDEGAESRDYLLFDRRDKTIYSVSAMDSRILVMPPQAVNVASPVTLEHRTVRDNEALPAVGGKSVTHYRLNTNGKLCYDLYAAEGLLPGAVQALREYREALAGQQAAALAGTPKELQTPCDLADNIFAPARHLDHGLPVRMTETGVRTSELVDYQTGYDATPGLFELPAAYRRMTIQELSGR